MKREIHICADDFGMNACINAGILALAARHRLSGTSCLVDGPLFEQDIARLQATGIQIGLHLNFTEFLAQDEAVWPLRAVILRSHARCLPARAVSDSIARQLRRFEDVAGHLPHYIDGHQHVQQLPQIRGALLSIVRQRYAGARLPWLRHGGKARSAGFPLAIRAKAQTIALLGAGALRREAAAAGFSLNNGFCGVYDFRGGHDAYMRWMMLWLKQCEAGDALMCHPALGTDAQDPHGAQRQAEYAVLSGDRMAVLLRRAGLEVAGAGSG